MAVGLLLSDVILPNFLLLLLLLLLVPLSEVASIIDILLMLLGIGSETKKTSTCPQVQSAMIITNFLSHPSPTKTTESIVYSHAWIDNLVQSYIDVTV